MHEDRDSEIGVNSVKGWHAFRREAGEPGEQSSKRGYLRSGIITPSGLRLLGLRRGGHGRGRGVLRAVAVRRAAGAGEAADADGY